MKIFDKIYFESGELSKELTVAVQKLPEKKGEFCRENRPPLDKHFKSVATDLQVCLLPQEKYLSDFMKKSFSGFLHFLCHGDGENVESKLIFFFQAL